MDAKPWATHPASTPVVLQREWLVSDAPEALEGLRKTLYLCEVKIAAMVGAPQFAGSALVESYLQRAGVVRKWALVSPDRVAPIAEHPPLNIAGPRVEGCEQPFFACHFEVAPSTEVRALQKAIAAAALPGVELYERVQAALHAWYAQDKYPDGDGGRTASAMDDLRKIIRHHARLHAVATAQIASDRARRAPVAAASGAQKRTARHKTGEVSALKRKRVERA